MSKNPMDSILFRKYTPKTIDDYICSDEFKEFLKGVVKDGKDFPHLLLSGIQGTGKTSLCIMLAEQLNAEYKYVNASKERGIDVIRNKVTNFCSSGKSLIYDYKFKILILDEMEQLTPEAQASLKSDIELYSSTTKFLCTTNNPHKIIAPIRDRLTLINTGTDFSKEMKKKYFKRLMYIIKNEGIELIGKDNKEFKKSIQKVLLKDYPSLRTPINLIQLESSKNNGKIDFIELANKKDVSKDLLKKIKVLLKKEDITGLHKLVFKHSKYLDTDTFYKWLLKNISEISDNDNSVMAELGKFIGERYYQSYIVTIKEINILSTLMGIIILKEEYKEGE